MVSACSRNVELSLGLNVDEHELPKVARVLELARNTYLIRNRAGRMHTHAPT